MNNERHQLASDGCPEFTSRSLYSASCRAASQRLPFALGLCYVCRCMVQSAT